MDAKPTHEQAQLQLQIYDQRREAKLRQARDWFAKNYIVNNIDDAMRIAPMGSETGAYVGMVIGYWEQACALLNYGLLHEDLLPQHNDFWPAVNTATKYVASSTMTSDEWQPSVFLNGNIAEKSAKN